jgi:hypothetical protein
MPLVCGLLVLVRKVVMAFEDGWKPTIQLNEEQTIAVRELDPTAYLPLKHDQLLP